MTTSRSKAATAAAREMATLPHLGARMGPYPRLSHQLWENAGGALKVTDAVFDGGHRLHARTRDPAYECSA